MLSTRSAFDLAPNALARALEVTADRPLLDLTESNPTRAGIPYDVEALLRSLGRAENLLYEPRPFGLPKAREAVARELSSAGPSVDAARVVLTASTSEAYSFLFKLLCDPGDEVLIPAPSYPLFAHLAQLESVVAVPFRLVYDGAWHLDARSLMKAVTARTRAVVVVSPNNPTGSFLKKAELAAIVATGLPIVSDEVFGGYSLRDDRSRMSTVLEASSAPLLFALGGLSKLAALPQMKLGWIAVDGAKDLVDRAMARLEVIADAFLSVSTPVQNAAAELLASRGTTERAIKARTRANLDWLSEAVEGTALTLLDVEGGWYATLRLPRTHSEEAWALSLLTQDDVHVHPGHYFDFEEEAYVVISLLTPEPTFREGIQRIVERVRRDA
jgi:aspartate/methionine/tyrosine aminotransferase